MVSGIWDIEHMNTHKPMEDPASSGTISWFVDLIGDRESLLPESLPDAKLQCGIDHQTQSHDHQKGHNPLRGLQEESTGQELRMLEEAKAFLHMSLPFITFQHLWSWEWVRI